MGRDRGWDDQAAPPAAGRERPDLGPTGHRMPGESNADALARLAGERDAARHDLHAIQYEMGRVLAVARRANEHLGELLPTMPPGDSITLATVDGDHLTVTATAGALEARLRAPMNAQRGIALSGESGRVLGAFLAGVYLGPVPLDESPVRLEPAGPAAMRCRVCGATPDDPTGDGGVRYFRANDLCHPCAGRPGPGPASPGDVAARGGRR